MVPSFIGSVLSIAIFSSALFAQEPNAGSLGELARRSRENKEGRPAARILTNANAADLPARVVSGNPFSDATDRPAEPYVLKLQPRKWANCAVLADDTTPNQGATTSNFEFSGGTAKVEGGWIYKGVVIAHPTSVTLPEWVNMPSDPAVRAVWDRLFDALRKHEEVHVNITSAASRELNGRTIIGSGPDPNAAQEDAQGQFDQLMQPLRRRQEQYDAMTEHGIKQSIIGGTDTTVHCP